MNQGPEKENSEGEKEMMEHEIRKGGRGGGRESGGGRGG